MKNRIMSLLQLSIFLCLFTLTRAQNTNLLIPSPVEREVAVNHSEHSLSFNTSYVLSHWVAYKVTKSKVDKSLKVKQKYKPDPKISGRTASDKDYKEGGYLMAQLYSYLDVSNSDVIHETFYMSNIVPMKLAFHKHVWLKIEDLIRVWSADSEGLSVICGPILKDSPFPTIGDAKVSVPSRYFKAVYDSKNGKAIGFIVKNGSTSPNIKGYAVSIDEIENETGLDLFVNLDDATEEKIESSMNKEDWNFNALK